MIATTRGLVVLAALALVLVLALLLVGPRGASRVDRTLVPGFEPDQVRELVLVRPGHVPLKLEEMGSTWQWSDDRATAEPATIQALFTALRGATWHRRAARSVAGELRGELRTSGGPRGTAWIGIGAELAGSDQTWLVIEDRAFLVDSWVARALFPEPLALRMRQPLAGALNARTLVTGPLRIERYRLVQPAPPAPLWLDPARVDALLAALAALEIVAMPPTPPGPPQLTIFYDGPPTGEVAHVGSCGDRVLVRTHAGTGCVEAAAWESVVDARDALLAAPADILDRRPLPFAPSELAVFGTPITLGPQPRVGDADGDPELIGELLAALSSPADVVPRPAGKPTSRITARDAAGTQVTLDLVGKTIVRDSEPLALRPSADAWNIITRPGSALRDPILWREDASTLSSLTIDGVTYTRGAVLGEWTRTPEAPFDPALVDALASALAIVRAPADPSTAPLPRRLRVTFTPPSGASSTHDLAIGAPTPEGCPARVDGTPVRLPLPLCTAAHAL